MTSHAIPAPVSASSSEYSEHVNPHWVRLLNLLQMNVGYDRCQGVDLFTTDGRHILDFLSGYCVYNAGHNHPRIVAALHDELDRNGPAMLQSHVANHAGELAGRLCRLAGGRARKAFFACSGSEGVESAIKFARAHTRRGNILAADHGFHGLTLGALSLMPDGFWKDRFGPFLPGVTRVPFNDIEAVRQALATRQYAAFITEPVQSEAGIRIPDAGYLREVGALCRRYGTLFVLDEVQTGMFRTGRFLAGHHFDADPDMVVLAKAMSGGLVPCSAVLMTEDIYDSVYGSLQNSIVHTSTFSENALAMRAALATLDVLEDERLGQRAIESGEYLRERLRQTTSGHGMVRAIRGLGLLNGIEFGAPSELLLHAPFETFRAIHPAMFGQVVVVYLFRDHGILAQICGNNFLVLKAAPPLVADRAHLDHFAEAIGELVDRMHSPGKFWGEALAIAKRAVRI
jgi:ornithine--oxo-acid transaminase